MIQVDCSYDPGGSGKIASRPSRSPAFSGPGPADCAKRLQAQKWYLNLGKTLSKPVRKALAKNNTFLRVSGTPRHAIRSHRCSRITFFRFQRRTQKPVLVYPISGPEILSKPIWNPFKNTHTRKALGNSQKKKEHEKCSKIAHKWEPRRM